MKTPAKVLRTLMTLVATQLLTGCIGLDFRNPYERRTTTNPSDGFIYLIPGVMGPTWDGNPSLYGVQNDLRAARFSSNVWNWPQHSSMKGKRASYPLDPNHCGPCASELRQRILNAPSPVSILAGSGGCLITAMACQGLPAGRLKDVVLISPAFDRTYDLSGAKQATSGSVWLYRSSNDEVLHRHLPSSAGLVGTSTPGINELKWESLPAPYGEVLNNDGTHMEAYRNPFFGHYVKPIFTNQWPPGARAAWTTTN